MNYYYFEVTLDRMPNSTVLVKAIDIIKAGEKAELIYGSGSVIRITRTKIEDLIDC